MTTRHTDRPATAATLTAAALLLAGCLPPQSAVNIERAAEPTPNTETVPTVDDFAVCYGVLDIFTQLEANDLDAADLAILTTLALASDHPRLSITGQRGLDAYNSNNPERTTQAVSIIARWCENNGLP